jgi:hypothetical protein
MIICWISACLRAACSCGVVAQAVNISAAKMAKLRMIVSFDDAPKPRAYLPRCQRAWAGL